VCGGLSKIEGPQDNENRRTGRYILPGPGGAFGCPPSGSQRHLHGRRAIEQAHEPDEFIDRDQLQRYDAMMDALLDTLAASDELIL
jgi:hypothetical protein